MAQARIHFGRGPGSMTPEKLAQLKSAAGYGPRTMPPNQGPNQNPYSFRR